MSDFTCMHHNDRARAACPVCLVTTLTAERDKLRAQNDQFSDNLSAVGAVYNAEKARAERAEAEAERYRLVTLRLDAELAIERARLDWLEKARPIAWALGSEECGEYWILTDLGEKHPEEAEEFATLRAAIDAAMKEGTK